jgi:cytochrome oxidase assembly protein ShyY1
VSTTAAALTVLATLAVSLPAAYWQIQRAASVESTRDRLVREAHERAAAAAVLDDAAINAGCDRLWDAITEHRKEDQP